MSEEHAERLFSYGTLQSESVQLATFGRRLEGEPDHLVGYKLTTVPIRDQSIATASGNTHYRNVQYTGIAADIVEGTVFAVSKEELERADEYESDAEYRRLRVQLRSGTTAWVYLFG